MSLRETLRSWLGFGAGVAMGGFGCSSTPGSRADAAPDTTADTSPDKFDGGVDIGRDVQVDSMPDNTPDRFDGGVDSYESLPDLRHDTTPDTSTCETTPRTFRGDGTYTVKPGDTITASNGVSFAVRNFCAESYSSMLDCYIGSERVNSLPIIPYYSWCSEFFGATIGTNNVHSTDCGNTLDISISSMYPGPIESRRDLYNGCRAAGDLHGLCSGLVPFEPTSTEVEYTHGRCQTITPSDADPAIGRYYLRQLELAREKLMTLFGISERTPRLSLRWYLPDASAPPHAGESIFWPAAWPGTEGAELDFIRGEETGGLAEMASHQTVIHEVSHVMKEHLKLHQWMEEGLGKYAEAYATDRNIHHEPSFEGTFPLGSVVEIPGYSGILIFSNYDSATGTVLLFRSRFAAKSHVTLGEDVLLTIESVGPDGVSVRVFRDGPFNRSRGWIYEFKTECHETDYSNVHGVYIDGEFYRSVGDSEVNPTSATRR